jgi:hypothetical protein
MVSSHVNRGRHNLAANAIWIMRRVGMEAYQTFPSKFCAYVLVPGGQTMAGASPTMTVQSYVRIERTEPIFDGQRAVHHLLKNLSMAKVRPAEPPDLLPVFNKWITRYNDSINLTSCRTCLHCAT